MVRPDILWFELCSRAMSLGKTCNSAAEEWLSEKNMKNNSKQKALHLVT